MKKVLEVIADRWVSWVLELGVLLLIAYFTVAEVTKTADLTREMLSKYDAAISGYTSEKTEALDNAVKSIKDQVVDERMKSWKKVF